MDVSTVTLITVIAHFALSVFKLVRQSQCELGWGCCACKSKLAEPKSPVAGPDLVSAA